MAARLATVSVPAATRIDKESKRFGARAVATVLRGSIRNTIWQSPLAARIR
jgi:hypothetical protein